MGLVNYEDLSGLDLCPLKDSQHVLEKTICRYCVDKRIRNVNDCEPSRRKTIGIFRSLAWTVHKRLEEFKAEVESIFLCPIKDLFLF